MKYTHKIYYILVFGMICLTGAAFIVIGIWSFYPDKILTVNDPNNVQVDKEVYQTGERITYTVDYCKSRRLPSILSASLVDGVRINYDAANSNFDAGCHVTDVSDLTIPSFVATGVYHLEITAEYQINPIRKSFVTFRTVDFRVENTLEKVSNQLLQHENQDTAKFNSILKK